MALKDNEEKSMYAGCVDLFCGAGGLTHGLLSEGVPVLAGIDTDPACRHPFEKNNRAQFMEKNVADVTPEEINRIFADANIRVLAGCAPCQPFSAYAQRYDTVGTEKWRLLYEFARLVKGVTPDLVVMENVPTVERHTVYRDFVGTLRENGYHVWHGVVDASNYGLPQRRRRMVLLASRIGPIKLIEPTHSCPVTVRETIGDLAPIRAGESLSSDPLHTAAKLSPINLERIRASRPGGTWRDWPEHLILECHRQECGKTYPSVYGRMKWDEPSPTLTTQFYGFGNGRFGHPEQDRALSLREGAILQSFPEDYSFVPDGAPIQFKDVGRMIGNAVPVTLGKVIGQSIKRHIDRFW
jgi:DNA (cytosine-5)-methyltransferase 1